MGAQQKNLKITSVLGNAGHRSPVGAGEPIRFLEKGVGPSLNEGVLLSVWLGD